jgi:hypothetical protein
MDIKLGVAALSAFAGIVATYLAAILKYRKDLEFKYDTDLREKRIPEYRALWRLLQPLARYSRPEPVTGKLIQQLSQELRQWYFEQGGLFLSDRSRDSYFALQDALTAVVADHKQTLSAVLTEETFERIRVKGSDLRTCMTRDVGTRKESKLN